MFKGNETLCKCVSNTVTVIQHSGNLLRDFLYYSTKTEDAKKSFLCNYNRNSLLKYGCIIIDIL